jgi:hypothetical protein
VHAIALSAVPQWTTYSNLWCPQSVDTFCPHCGRFVNLVLGNQGAAHGTILANARCPGCSKLSRFYVVDPGNGKDASKRGCALLAIHPDPLVSRSPVVAPEKLESQALARAYEASLAAYNSGLWAACATSCRRTLEGILHTLLPEAARTGTLFDQLERLPKEVDLSKPLVALANSLRKGGNIAAHFNLDKEPDQSTAQIMLDLLDYLMEYIYALRDKAQELEERLEAVPPPDNQGAGCLTPA